MVARGDGSSLDVNEMNAKHVPPTGDHEGPPNPTSSTLAPTDVDAYGGDCSCIPQMRGPTHRQGAVVPGFPDRVPLGTLLH
jgi:hypothetical protein